MKNSKNYTTADVEIVSIHFDFSSACQIHRYPCVFNSTHIVTPEFITYTDHKNSFPKLTSFFVYSRVGSCLDKAYIELPAAFTPETLAEYFRNPENVEKLKPLIVDHLNNN